MVARLVPIRHEKAALTRALQPHGKHGTQDKYGTQDEHDTQDTQDEHGQPPRGRPAARHARTSGPPAPQHTSLSIRSAERRRWSADLARPDVTALVVYGLGGIGKSTLATQIASRMSRLAPDRVVSVLCGEVSAACLAAAPAETDLVVLDNFDDNLSGQDAQRAVRDPALAAVIAGWTGKLLQHRTHRAVRGDRRGDRADGGPAAARRAVRPAQRRRPGPGRARLGVPQPGHARRAGLGSSCWPTRGSPSRRRPRAALAAGRVDARLLITLAALAANAPVQILAFGDDGPGAGAGTPLRTAEITGAVAATRAMLAFVRAQRPPFFPARSALSGGPGGLGARTVLTIGFTAPSPLGLLPSQR